LTSYLFRTERHYGKAHFPLKYITLGASLRAATMSG